MIDITMMELMILVSLKRTTMVILAEIAIVMI